MSNNINIPYSAIKKAKNEIADLFVSGNISENTFDVVSKLIDIEITKLETSEIISEINYFDR